MSRPGRRAGTKTTRDDLLRAGAALLQENGLQALSAREAALRANVNPAMVRHFFKDRLGYLAALMDYGFERMLSEPNAPAEPASLDTLVRTLHSTPWLAHLLVQTVYAGDTLRAHFEQKHAPRLLAYYRAFLVEGQARGTIRRDLPENIAVTGLISLIVFPIVAAKSLEMMLFQGGQSDLAEVTVTLITRLYANEVSHHPL